MDNVQAINESSPHLEAVMRLWREHSDTLGYFPEGAFHDYAREQHIGVALDGNGICVGYLLYRIVRDQVTIVHFCVDKQFRRRGYARAMLNWLIEATKKRRGIMLSCRTDYDASKTWGRLGFYPIGKKPGRAGEIEIWWQSHGHPDLFSTIKPPGAIEAVVDANVFLDFVDKQNEETLGLQADWLIPFVTICYTPELLIEINRNQDAANQKRRRAEAEQFKMLECSAEDFHNVEKKLLPVFPNQTSEQDESDFRHLVRAVAANADVFVTRDGGILKKADEVFKLCGLAIVRPGEFATQIDVLQQEHVYQRTQVAGTNQVFQTRITAVDDALVLAIKANQEKHHEIRKPLNRYLAEPHRFYPYKITNPDGAVLAVYVIDREGSTDRVPLLRVCDERRTATLTRAVLTSIVREAAKQGGKAVLITDRLVEIDACADLGFLPVEQGQLKLILSGWLSIEQIPGQLTWQNSQVDEIKKTLHAARTDAMTASELEHLLWPCKISDAILPSFIVPIRAKFAEHLFDGRLAKGSLFGADVDLALNPESAYYRAARPAILSAPARVLWYVSHDDKFEGTMSIRACSRIVEVVVGTPQQLFKRFRRLGVYEWNQVLETAGAIDKEIMAIRFDDTELLPPISWDDFQAILKSQGVNNNIQSPVSISADVFGKLYVAALNSSQARTSNTGGREGSGASQA